MRCSVIAVLALLALASAVTVERRGRTTFNNGVFSDAATGTDNGDVNLDDEAALMNPNYDPSTQEFRSLAEAQDPSFTGFPQRDSDDASTVMRPTFNCGTRYVSGASRGQAECVKFTPTSRAIRGESLSVTTLIIGKLDEMFAAADAAGVRLQLNSGFRTQAEQQALRNRNCRNGTCRPATAPAGYSNHQNGIAVDINAPPAHYDWLTKNARRFGFIRAVPSERWHWEYHPGLRCDAIVKVDKLSGRRYTCV